VTAMLFGFRAVWIWYVWDDRKEICSESLVGESAIAFVHFDDLGLMKDALAGLCSVAPHLGIVMDFDEQINC